MDGSPKHAIKMMQHESYSKSRDKTNKISPKTFRKLDVGVAYAPPNNFPSIDVTKRTIKGIIASETVSSRNSEGVESFEAVGGATLDENNVNNEESVQSDNDNSDNVTDASDEEGESHTAIEESSPIPVLGGDSYYSPAAINSRRVIQMLQKDLPTPTNSNPKAVDIFTPRIADINLMNSNTKDYSPSKIVDDLPPSEAEITSTIEDTKLSGQSQSPKINRIADHLQNIDATTVSLSPKVRQLDYILMSTSLLNLFLIFLIIVTIGVGVLFIMENDELRFI